MRGLLWKFVVCACMGSCRFAVEMYRICMGSCSVIYCARKYCMGLCSVLSGFGKLCFKDRSKSRFSQ